MSLSNSDEFVNYAWCMSLGAPDSSDYHLYSDPELCIQRATAMEPPALHSSLLQEDTLLPHVSLAHSNFLELLQGDEGARICASGMDTSKILRFIVDE